MLSLKIVKDFASDIMLLLRGFDVELASKSGAVSHDVLYILLWTR